jgi:serine/threonine protein kinase
MVHLDVKPGNIIMAAPPVLIDFSVARSVEQASRITSETGTDAYRAPEQRAPARLGPIGPAADVWGAGATLYEAITGQPAFATERPDTRDLAGSYTQLEADPPPLPPETPPALAEAVLRCLDRDPGSRPTASEVGMSLQPLVASAKRRSVLGVGRPRLR